MIHSVEGQERGHLCAPCEVPQLTTGKEKENCRRTSRLPTRVSNQFFQMPLDFPSSAHQIPVRTPTTGPQAFLRTECNDHSWEVILTHEVVKWTPTTGPLAWLPTKHQILHLLLQFVSQGSAHVLPSRNQNSSYQGFWPPRFMFVDYGLDLIVKVRFVFIVLDLEVPCLLWWFS